MMTVLKIIWIPVLLIIVNPVPSTCFITNRSTVSSSTSATTASTKTASTTTAPTSTTAAFQGADSTGGMVMNTVQCAPGLIFCFETKKCVRVDGSCAEPTCDSNIQLPELCHMDGRLQCTDGSGCDHVQVITKLDADFDSMVGYDMAGHVAFNDDLRRQIADYLALNKDEVWDLSSAGSGSMWVTFKAVPRVQDTLEDIFVRECNQFLRGPDGRELHMDCSQAYVYRPLTERYCFQEWCPSGSYCRYGQVYCFLTRSCVDVDGSCSCANDQESCWSTGSKECVAPGTCQYFTVYMQIDADYASTVGKNEAAFSEHIRLSLTALLGVSQMAIPWLVVSPGSVWVYMWTSYPDMKENIQALVDRHVFPSDMHGNVLSVSNIGMAETGGDVGEEHGVQCGDGQVFCMMRRECVDIHTNVDGTVVIDGGEACGGPEHEPRHGVECPYEQVFCMMRRECVDIHTNIDGTVVVDGGEACGGPEHEPRHGVECPYGQVFCMMRRECVSIHTNVDGTFVVGGGEECGEPEHRPRHREQCQYGQVFCMMSRKCVSIHRNGDHVTTSSDYWKCGHVPPTENGCPPGKEECWSTGLKECLPLGECPKFTGDDNGDEDEHDVHCDQGKIFCMMRRRCISVTEHIDFCTDSDTTATECPSSLEVLCRNEKGVQVCMQPNYCTSYISVDLKIDSNYEDTLKIPENDLLVEYLTSVLNISRQRIDGLEISMSPINGTIDIRFALVIADIVQMEIALMRLETLVNRGELFTIAGHSYAAVIGSLILGFSHVTGDHNDEKCSNDGCTCPQGEIYCLMSKKCVIKHSADDCTIPHSKCPSEKFWCPGAADNDGLCLIKGSHCETDGEGSSETDGSSDGRSDDDCSTESCTCLPGQIYCMMRRQCVILNTNTSCNITNNVTECPREQEYCRASTRCMEIGECEQIHQPDVFIARLLIRAEGVINRYRVGKRVEKLQSYLMHQLKASRHGDSTLDFKWLVILPTSALDEIVILVKLEVHKNNITYQSAVSVADLTNHFQEIELTTSKLDSTPLELSQAPQVVKVPERATYKVFLLPNAISSGKKYMFSLKSLLSPDSQTGHTESDVPDTVTIDCTGKQVEIMASETNASRVVVGYDEEIGILHQHPTIGLVECELERALSPTTEAEPTVQEYKLGFIAIPYPLENPRSELYTPRILLRNTSLVLDESDEETCHTFDDNMFSIRPTGNALFELLDNWPQNMLENNEIWVGDNIHLRVQTMLQMLEYNRKAAMLFHRAHISVSKDTRRQNNRLVAVLRYGKETLPEDGFETDLFVRSDNVRVCVTPDFSGTFVVEINQVNNFKNVTTGTASETIAQLKLTIQVVNTNDAPTLRSRGLDDLRKRGGLIFPRSPLPDDGNSTYVPEYTIADLASVLFHDKKDMNTDLGIAVLGFESTRIDGTWEYFSSASGIWSAVEHFEWETLSNGEITTVILLSRADKIKFTPDSKYSATNWINHDAPRLYASGWDGSNIDETNGTAQLSLTRCPKKPLSKEIAPFCIDTGKTSPYSSHILRIPLERKGCDGQIGSGLHVTAECGKCNIYDCRDCNGVNSGGAEFDACGICGGLNKVFNCSVDECRAKNTLRCKQEDKANEIVEACTAEGKVFKEGCPTCVDDDLDDVCNDCGLNSCLDCNGVPYGDSYLNLCHMCTSPDTQTNDCETIGNIQPAAICILTPVNITIDVASTLANNSIADIQCSLRPVNTTNSTAAITVLVRKVEQSTVTMELTVPAEEAADSVGTFAIACSFAGSAEFSTEDHNEYLLRYSHPTLTSITPTEQYIDSLSQVTILGDNIVDTGSIQCIIPHCRGRNKCWFKRLPAERLSQTEVVCDVTSLRTFGVGRLYDLHVILGPITQVDMTSLPPAVQFSVKRHAPNMTDAKLDGDWCPFLYIYFDKPIAIVNNEGDVRCADIFDNNIITSHLQNAECAVHPNLIKIKYDAPIEAGTELTLRDDVIKDARDTSDMAEFATGSVFVSARDDQTADVGLKIYGPDIVGDIDVSFEVRTENSGCLTFDLQWDVDILDEDSSDSSLSRNIETLRTSLAAIEIKRRAFLSIFSNQLLPGITYEYTLNWTAEQNVLKAGSVKKNLTRDDTTSIIVDIFGIKDGSEVNPMEMIKVDCNLLAARIVSEEKDPSFLWELTPRHYSLDSNKATFVPENQLVGGQTYILQCHVTWDATIASAEIEFKTAKYPVKALINNEEKATINIPFGDSLVLDSSESLDGAMPFDGKYSWICENNLFNVDVFGPCIGGDSSTVVRDVSNFDFTPSYSRLDQTLRVRWTLTIRKDTRTDVATINLNYYKPTVHITLPDVLIEQKHRTNFVSDDIRTITIEAHCDASRYVWTTDISGTGSRFIDMNVITGVHEGELESDTYEPCGVTFDFSDVSLSAADIFVMKLEAIRDAGETVLSKPITVQIRILSKPIYGDILVTVKDEAITAHSTEVKIVLTDWRDDADGTNLLCNFYYIETESAEPIKINKKKMEYNLPLIATLPEGTIQLGARCSNRMGVWSEFAYSSEILTVIPMQNFTKALSTLSLLFKTDAPGTFAIVRALLKMVVAKEQLGVSEESNIPEITAEEKAVIREKANEEALNLLPDDPTIDTEETLEAMGTTIDIFGQDKDNIAPETKLKMQRTAEDVTKKKTGATAVTSNTRKKRSATVTYFDGVGLSETDATTVLQTFQMTINDETSLTKDVAISLITMVDLVMVGLCQNGTKSPMTALTGMVNVRLERRALYDIGDTQVDIICGDCPTDVPYPATVQYGAYLSEKYAGAWDCISDKPYGCNDVCLASAQLSVDAVTPTATDEVLDPGRKSDIIVTKIVNPNSYATEVETNLTTPAVFTLQTNSDVDTVRYDLTCKMWLAETWSDVTCATGVPVRDNSTSTYTVTCTCTALGILGLFQDLRPEEITTALTTALTTPTSTITTLDANATTTIISSTTQQQQPPTTHLTTTTTAAPAKELPAATVSAKCSFTLDEDYSTQMATTSLTAMRSRIKQDLMLATGYSGNSFKNLSFKPGSIIVSFDLFASGLPGDATLGQMVFAIERLVQTGSLILHNPDGGVMALLTDTFTFESQSGAVDKDDDDDDDHIGDHHDGIAITQPAYIVGGVLGSLVIVGVFIILGMIVVKLTKRQQTVHAQSRLSQPSQGYAQDPAPLGVYPGISPPPYGHQPPAEPPYADTKKSGDYGNTDRRTSVSATGVGSSDRHPEQKYESRQLTPVDN